MATTGQYVMTSLPPLMNRLKRHAKELGIKQSTVELDYLLSWLLASIASDPILKSLLIFKGGTALKKCYFPRYRFSEDLDFTALPGTPTDTELEQLLVDVTRRAEEKMNEFAPVLLRCEPYKEKEPHPENQKTFAVRAQFPSMREPLVKAMIEITFTERLAYPPQLCPISHIYEEPIKQEILVYPYEEIIIEKLRGILQHTKKLHENTWTRSRARDYYDLYTLLLAKEDLFSDNTLSIHLGNKCIAKEVSYESAEDFFAPRFIQEVKKDWDLHLVHLVKDLPTLETVLGALKPAINGLLECQPTLGQLLGYSKFHSLLNDRDLLNYVKFRLQTGANPNDVQNNSHTPLTIALQRNKKDIALLLIEYGADIHFIDASGLSAFEWAIKQKSYDIAYQIHKQGQPYTPRSPDQHFKVPYPNLYEFERIFFS